MDEKESSSIIPDSVYKELILSGVDCSCCGVKLSNDEITMHKHVGITEAKDMLCQVDWMRSAYMGYKM